MLLRQTWSRVALQWTVWAAWLTSSVHAISRQQQQQQVNIKTNGSHSVLFNTNHAGSTTVPNNVINATFINGSRSSDIEGITDRSKPSGVVTTRVTAFDSVSLLSPSSAGVEYSTAYVAAKPDVEDGTKPLTHTAFVMVNKTKL
nr:uncharacterized protein LOC123762832 [Procambarus clarkii]